MADGDTHGKPVGAPAIPRRFLVVNVIGTCTVVALGLALYIGQNSDIGLFVAVWALVAAPITWWLAVQSRRRLYDATRREDRRTGQILTRPPVSKVSDTLNSASQWIGGADVPGLYWRVNTGVPFAMLEVVDSSLILRVRPEAFARLTWGIETLVVSPSEVEAVFPARSRLRVPAIGIRPLHGPPSYFLTAPLKPQWYVRSRSADRSSILSVIEAAGFPVEWEERRFSRA
jgi:hypothetical protein